MIGKSNSTLLEKRGFEILAIIGKPMKSNKLINYSIPEKENLIDAQNNTQLSFVRKQTIQISELAKHIKDPYEEIIKKHEKFVISSTSQTKFIYDLFIGVLILYSTISALFTLAFVKTTSADFFTEIGIWIVFCLDFILTFLTSFKNSHGHEVKNFMLIAQRYLKTWLFPDLITLVPFSLFNMSNIAYVIRLIRILKIRKYSKLINITKLANFFCNLFRIESKLKRKKIGLIFSYSWDMAKIITFALIISFAIASLWWFSSMTFAKYFPPTENFIIYFNLENCSESTQALRTLYFVFSTLTTTGYGDYYAINSYERIINIFFVILGPTFFVYILGSGITIIKDFHELTATKNYSLEFNKWVSQNVRKKKYISNDLKNRINDFFLSYHKMINIESIGNFPNETENPENVLKVKDFYLSRLPDFLKDKVIEFYFAEMFYCFNYFFSCNKTAKFNFALYFQPRFYKDDVILDYGEEAMEVLFVTQGLHKIQKSDGETLCIVEKDRLIGDYFCYKSQKSWFRFMAEGMVEGYAVPENAFIEFTSKEDRFDRYFDLVKLRYEDILHNGINCRRSLKTNYEVRKTVSKNLGGLVPKKIITEFDNLGLDKITEKFKYLRKNLQTGVIEKLIKMTMK